MKISCKFPVTSWPSRLDIRICLWWKHTVHCFGYFDKWASVCLWQGCCLHGICSRSRPAVGGTSAQLCVPRYTQSNRFTVQAWNWAFATFFFHLAESGTLLVYSYDVSWSQTHKVDVIAWSFPFSSLVPQILCSIAE